MIFVCNPLVGASDDPDQAASNGAAIREVLLGSGLLQKPLATSAFLPAEKNPMPAQAFSGLLALDSDSGSGHIEVLVDTFGITGDENLKLTSLPPFALRFISEKDVIIPLVRQPQRSSHPYWEIILAPGKVWSDKSDDGWSRASLPFALKGKNQNCTHNGVLTFLYKEDGSISRLFWQVTSETCLYLKVNLWGVATAQYQPQFIPDHEKVSADYRGEFAQRLPVKSFHTLKDKYPAIDPSAFIPPGPEDLSVYGFIVDGVHYRSDCPTRYGNYPFCDTLVLPSYSLAKSVFAGLGYLLLSRKWPEFADMTVTDLIPECVLDDHRWQQVSMKHLVNMSTGLYDSTEFESDENAPKMDTFFLAESHQGKVRFSCEAWPKKTDAGMVSVYHTTDTYLLGVAMANFLKTKQGPDADVHNFLHQNVFKQLELSPLSEWTQRTYDDRAQPFTGYGLMFYTDDIAKIATSLNSHPDLPRALTGEGFDAAMFRGPAHEVDFRSLQDELAYHNGFWGFRVSEVLDCELETWIPFMSGYGGIVVTMFPKGGVYYYFSDSGQHTFKKAAIEANKALNYCKES